MKRLLRIAILLASAAGVLHGQAHEPALSDAEVDRLRETADQPDVRVSAFTVFLDDRVKAIQALMAGRRHPGREQDVHDQMTQFASIADDLEDNLDDYTRAHKDIRKPLGKLKGDLDRWETALKLPPDDPETDVARKLALEAVGDLREDLTTMIPEQAAWFKEHPPGKPPKASRPE